MGTPCSVSITPTWATIALPDGEVTEPTESQFHSPAEVVAYYVKDLEFVISQIAELNRANPDKTFTGKFDMARIAAIGHRPASSLPAVPASWIPE